MMQPKSSLYFVLMLAFLFARSFAAASEKTPLPDFLNSSITNPILSMIATPPFDSEGKPLLTLDSQCGSTVDSKEAKCYLNHESQDFRRAYRKSRAVVRILRNNRPHCTGFLIGDAGHVLTNWHCAQSASITRQLSIEAMAEGASCETDCRSALACGSDAIVNYDSLEFIYTGGSIQHDFTLLKLSQEDYYEFRSLGHFKLRSEGAMPDEEVYVPQHPKGYGKQLAIAIDPSGEVGRILSTRTGNFNGCGTNQVAYLSDTSGGSSGSPVVSFTDHKVVAVHHCGKCSKFANTGINTRVVSRALLEHLPTSAF